MNRKYTGWDKNATGRRAGLEELVDQLEQHFGVWNNGTWGVRDKRGKQGNPSVHSTARAADLSWRKMSNKGSGRYADAVNMMDFLALHADDLEIEAIFDYYPEPHGRGWKCDRADKDGGWQTYSKRTFSGSPGGDWVHIEISNKFADDAAHYARIIPELLKRFPVTQVSPPVVPEKTATVEVSNAYPGTAVRRGSRGKVVKKVQARVGAVVDGNFGPKTESSVKGFQRQHVDPVTKKTLLADGIVGPKTWRTMFPV